MKMTSDLIYGKSDVKDVVNVSVTEGLVTIFLKDGSFTIQNHEYFILWPKAHFKDFGQLDGDLYYRYYSKYDNKEDFLQHIFWAKRNGHKYYTIWNETESFLTKNGYTYYKGMQFEELSVLSFDIETTGLMHNQDSRVLLISNTFKDSSGNIERKLFAYDDYKSTKEFIEAWESWVIEKDPNILAGHNIFGFDIPYIQYCLGRKLQIGKENKELVPGFRSREFRKDGSQSYTYTNYTCFGREIIDTFFLSIKYDVARKYPSYRLKQIIEFEGLEREDRQHYDASQIHKRYKDAAEWKKIKEYAIHDADDSLALFNLMAPSYFYYCQSISKPFQEIILGATGSQVNNIMVRSYLQEGHSIPKASPVDRFKGGISYGNPGVYHHVNKVDVASLYPSIILDKEIYDSHKDPKGHMLEITRIFTEERLKNKALTKETGERYYNDLQSAQKIVINSIYGFMGATGLNFNSPLNAEYVTKCGREILNKGIDWAKNKGYSIVNADTDSFTYTSGQKICNFAEEISELNRNFTDKIVWEDDGQYESFVVIKAKNYIMRDYDGKVTTKGSGLKATMKEPALREFIDNTLTFMLDGKIEAIPALYDEYALEIMEDMYDIERWASKKTITKAVLSPNRTNEARVLMACKDRLDKGELSEGDKIKVFFETETSLKMIDDFKDVYHIDTLLKKLFATVKIFDNILDMDQYPNYKLKKNKPLLAEILNG